MRKVFFAYPTNRRQVLMNVTNGLSPDNELYGLNHLKLLGLNATFRDVSSSLTHWLDYLFAPFTWLFKHQIDIGFQMGRALLLLPAMNRADVVLTNTDSIGLPICLLKRIGLLRPPVVYAVGLFYIRGKLKESVDNNKDSLFRRFYTWILSAADHIIYHSPIEKEKLVQLGIYNPGYCTFVAMGSDSRFFQKRVNSEFRIQNSELVLSVGRDHARDYKTLFEAAKELPDIEFVVICSRRNIEGLIVPGNVKVLLDLTYREVKEWYKRATIVVIPMREMHRSSGQMTLTDAIQAGKAIVASSVIGISHYGLKSGIDVLLVPPSEIDPFKEAVSRIINDRSLRWRLEKQSSRLAKVFTTENYTINISDAIEWAADPIRLRPLRREDLEFVRHLRNENRQYFFDSNYISKQDQLKWYEGYRKNTDDYMFILEINGERAGIGAIYHINKLQKSAEIGRFVIDSKFRNRGFGQKLIEKLERIALVEMGLKKLTLEVLKENISVFCLYEKAGFSKSRTLKHEAKDVIAMVKSLSR